MSAKKSKKLLPVGCFNVTGVALIQKAMANMPNPEIIKTACGLNLLNNKFPTKRIINMDIKGPSMNFKMDFRLIGFLVRTMLRLTQV